MKASPVEEKEVEIKKLTPTKTTEDKEEWFESEGKLAVDVYQTESELIIQSAVAGVKVEDLDILIERDLISIRGVREKPFSEEGDYFTQECYWGPFSREIILPVEVDPNRIEASMKEGVLTVRIPKLLREKKRKIKVKKLA
jgi:HSP20 family protein